MPVFCLRDERMVSFKLLGLFAGYVGLRGRLEAVGDAGDTVKVQFQPPELSLGSAVVLRIGPPSSVQLTTTYLDEQVRLGLGSRGSLFVFRRGGVSDREGVPPHGGSVAPCQCCCMTKSMRQCTSAATMLDLPLSNPDQPC